MILKFMHKVFYVQQKMKGTTVKPFLFHIYTFSALVFR